MNLPPRQSRFFDLYTVVTILYFSIEAPVMYNSASKKLARWDKAVEDDGHDIDTFSAGSKILMLTLKLVIWLVT